MFGLNFVSKITKIRNLSASFLVMIIIISNIYLYEIVRYGCEPHKLWVGHNKFLTLFHNVSRIASDGLEFFLLTRASVFVFYIYVFNDGTGLFVVVVNDSTTRTIMTMLDTNTSSLCHLNTANLLAEQQHFRYLIEKNPFFDFCFKLFFLLLLYTFAHLFIQTVHLVTSLFVFSKLSYKMKQKNFSICENVEVKSW